MNVPFGSSPAGRNDCGAAAACSPGFVAGGYGRVMKLTPKARVDPNKLLQLINDNPQVRFTPNGVLSFPLKAHGPQVIDAIDDLLQSLAAA